MRFEFFEDFLFVYDYAGVKDKSFGFVYEERVDVHFFKLRKVNQQL